MYQIILGSQMEIQPQQNMTLIQKKMNSK